MTFRGLLEAYRSRFFDPISPISLALYRIVYGLQLLTVAALLAPEFLLWYGDRGLVTRAAGVALADGPRLALMRYLPQGNAWPAAFFALFILAACSLTVGFRTRLSAFVVYVTMTSLHHRNLVILNSGDTLLRVLSFFMMFSNAGDALSVDRLLRVAKGLESPDELPKRAPWAQRLMQIQIALLYLGTFAWKAAGAKWLDGSATYYTSRLVDFQRFTLPWVFDTMPMVRLATWSALLIEGALGTLVFFRDLRYPILLLGILLHLLIEWTMNIPIFEWIMMGAYIPFLLPDDLTRWGQALAQRWKAAPLVVLCPEGQLPAERLLAVLQTMDLLGRLELRLEHHPPEPSPIWLRVRLADGTVRAGPEAWRAICQRVPALWCWVPYLWLGGGRRMGPLLRKLWTYFVTPRASLKRPGR